MATPVSGSTGTQRHPNLLWPLGLGSLEDIRFHLPPIYVTVNISVDFPYGYTYYINNLVKICTKYAPTKNYINCENNVAILYISGG